MKPDLFAALQAARASHRPIVVATATKSGAQAFFDGAATLGDLAPTPAIRDAAAAALREDKSRTIETPEHGPVFVHVHNPPLRMLIVGAVHIAQALAPMAAMAGYAVPIVDPRRSFATAARFPGVEIVHEWPDEAFDRLQPDLRTAVVALTHDPKIDDPALDRAFKSPCFYIGALGSTRTHAKRVARLKEAGFSDAEIARIHAPIGLKIAAQSPAEIAVSILAEVTQVLRRAPVAAP